MSRFRAAFASRHVVLPIVHVRTRPQTLRNLHVAREAGADGAFLLSHGELGDDELLAVHHDLARDLPGFWVGVNCLGLSVEEVFARAGARVAGVWTDDALIDEGADDQPAARRVLEAQRAHGWRGLYFGGVAFKYQRPVHDVAQAARRAAGYMDVVTTSGPGTGQAASPEKVRRMKKAIGEHPLALASGVTPENVTDYLPWVDAVLVATGISYNFEDLEPARVRDLVRIVRAWRPRV
jgi:predicted TIM-barrel enzyme